MDMTPNAAIDTIPAHLMGLYRHFIDLRDGKHGDNAVTRENKENLFAEAVNFLDAYARQVLTEMNETLLLNTGSISSTGLVRSSSGDLAATWSLSWHEQAIRHIKPVTLQAFFGHGFHHPHLRGATVGNWPLNVFSIADASAELPTLRVIANADLHNLVFQSNYHIIPAVIAPGH
jgi:hypothetical protein